MIQQKRAQVTSFIIITIILVSAIGAYFLISNNPENNLEVPSEVKPVNDFVNSCLKEVADNGTKQIGLHGGYYLANSSLGDNVQIYLEGSTIKTPKINVLEKELSLYIQDNLNSCLRNFKTLSDFKINATNSGIKTSIENESLTVELSYPLTIQKNGAVYRLTNFNAEIPAPLGKIHYAAEKVILKQAENESVNCLTCLADIADETDLLINMIDGGDMTTFLVSDYNKNNNQTYILIFGRVY